jgi:hypothetical protein
MSWDEYEYYFELEELEPFAGVPLSDLFLGVAAEAPRKGTHLPPTTSIAPKATSRKPDDASKPDQVCRPLDDATYQGANQSAPLATEEIPHPECPISDRSAIRPESPIARESALADFSTSRASDTIGPRVAGSASESLQSTGVFWKPSADSGTANTTEQPGRMHRGAETWQERMSVHVLGQFAFCSRAGIYSAEHGDEADLDEPPPALNYLPNFELEQIEERLSELLRQVGWLVALLVTFVLGMAVGVVNQERWVFYPALAGAAICMIVLFETFGAVLTLVWRRAAARRAKPHEPSLTLDRIEPVNWWSLLKAGFEPVAYQRQFRHPDLPLEGSPWRVLERGSLRIPVIKSGGDRLGDAKHAVYPKHELRLAAYAVLLEATEHVQVPYGLVFPVDSHWGLAVPITPKLRAQVAELLERASDLLVRSQRGEAEPRPPRDPKHCARCRLGAPLPISEAEIHSARKTRTRLLILTNSQEDTFHCLCGDRFGSAPPHRQIVNRGLRASVE